MRVGAGACLQAVCTRVLACSHGVLVRGRPCLHRVLAHKSPCLQAEPISFASRYTYHQFTDWIAFGGPVLRSGDPVEQEKRIKYRDLVANAVMLHNVVDMTNVLRALRQKGACVTPEVVRRLSPYLTEHIKRFGQYVLDMDIPPEPLQPIPLFGATLS